MGRLQRETSFIAYLDDFWIMMWVTLAAVPLVLLLRPAVNRRRGNCTIRW
ncbi:MAG: hypothetical protein ABIT69_08530 [Sphingomicrobium sp.]